MRNTVKNNWPVLFKMSLPQKKQKGLSALADEKSSLEAIKVLFMDNWQI